MNPEDSPEFLHHGDVLEAVATRINEFASVGVLTLDNQRATYHQVSLDTRPVALLTSPVPRHMTSGLDVFNEKPVAVRALVFGDVLPVLRVSGAINGVLEFVRNVTNGVSLWELPGNHTLGLGSHTLIMSGNWSGSCHFTTGNVVAAFEEGRYVRQSGISFEFFFAWLMVFLIAIAIPISLTGIGEDFEEWIAMWSNESRWLLAFAGGFLIIKRRIRKTPIYFQWILFLALLWPLVLPVAFFRIEKLTAVLWLWGYFCGSSTQSLYMGARLSVSYLGCVIVPVVMVASAAAAVHLRPLVVVVDLSLYFVGIGINGYLIYFLMDLCGPLTGLTSPMYVFIPVVLHTALWIAVVQMRKREGERRVDAQRLI
jgi:hypothetical protein